MTRHYITKEKKAELLKVSMAIIEEEGGQVTLRHLYYRLVSCGLLDKTEAGYDRLCNYTKDWRLSGAMPYTALTDNTRYYHGVIRFGSPEEAVATTLKYYKKDIWADWNAHKEIWTEKDAMIPILLKAADPLGVKVFSTHGYSSISAMANTVTPYISDQLRQDKNVYIYYFGDHDPSGKDIDRVVRKAFDMHLRDSEKINFNFERVAVLPEDIEKYSLQTRPTKKSDPRSEDFKGESVELDAMDIKVIQQRVRDCIMENVPTELMEEALYQEHVEQERIDSFVRSLASGGKLALT